VEDFLAAGFKNDEGAVLEVVELRRE